MPRRRTLAYIVASVEKGQQETRRSSELKTRSLKRIAIYSIYCILGETIAANKTALKQKDPLAAVSPKSDQVYWSGDDGA